MTTLLEPPVRNWKCPSCGLEDRTQRPDVHTQMHACPALSDLNIPLVEVKNFDDKVKARHVLVAREDYLGDDEFAGPISGVSTDHMDGSNDATVFAPCAKMELVQNRGAVNRMMKDIVVTPEPGQVGARNRHVFQDTKLARMARIARRYEALMTFNVSAGNAYYMTMMGANTAKASTDAFKVAIYGNTPTPVQSATQSATQYNGAGSQWVTANEVSSAGYTAGGQWMSSTPSAAGGTNNTTWTQGTNVVTFTSSGSPQWTGVTFTAYGCLVYDYTTSTTVGQAISWNYFGGAQTVTAGTFTITWNASGIVTLTC